MIESNYHKDWQQYRLEFLLKQVPKDFFEGKAVLELGPLNGFFGASLHALGANVTCVEGRLEHIKAINKTFPQLKLLHADLDSPEWFFGKFDIIINFGLFYHLNKYHKEHLLNCLDNCDTMFFESVVYDSPKAEIFHRLEEGYDQSLSNVGGTPSTSFIENIFKEKRVLFKKYCDEELNAVCHCYNWKDEFNESYNEYRRRFWITRRFY